jgi:hypothetical protein
MTTPAARERESASADAVATPIDESDGLVYTSISVEEALQVDWAWETMRRLRRRQQRA